MDALNTGATMSSAAMRTNGQKYTANACSIAASDSVMRPIQSGREWSDTTVP